MTSPMSSFPSAPNVQGDLLLDNDLLPYQHFIPAYNVLDTFAGVGVGAQQLFNATWPFSVVSFTTLGSGEMGWYVPVAAGTWTIDWITSKRNDYGIAQAKVDSASVGGTIDLYTASVPAVFYMHSVAGVVLTAGHHLFTIASTGTKNASSSALYLAISGLSLTRTA